ncbi:MAG: hypothetical protein HY051_04135 [Candidatus Aenigmarchaeota archaeon]|nr:hypothetical protein [Candidatus Aenigmarchaeota archaeon]
MAVAKSNLAIAAFTGLTMLVSVLGFAFLQGSPQANRPEEKLPDSYIINYTLTQSQRQTLANRGKTLIDLVYDPQNCTNCGFIKASLEGIAHQFSDQILLSEIEVSRSDYVDLPRVFMASQINAWSKKGAGITAAELEQAFCSVVLYPPLGCAIKPQPGNNTNRSQ